MNEDDIEELISVIAPAAAAVCQIKERKEKTESKVRNKSCWTEGIAKGLKNI